MANKGLSRRQFVTGAAVAVAASAIPVLTNVTVAAATPTPTYPFATPSWVPLDAKVLARQAWEIYKGKWANQSACCEATFWPIVGSLAATYGAGSSWDLVPKGFMNYGGGGVNGYGSICGNPNGASNVLKLIGAPSNVMQNFMTWYESTYLPTNACYLDYKSGTWVAGGSAAGVWGGTGLAIPLNNAPKIKAGSILCHVGLTKWRAAAETWNVKTGGDQSSDRCGKLCYDSVYYLATLINTWKAGGTITANLSYEAGATGCRNVACHGAPVVDDCSAVTAQGLMKCTPCHTKRVGDGHNL